MLVRLKAAWTADDKRLSSAVATKRFNNKHTFASNVSHFANVSTIQPFSGEAALWKPVNTNTVFRTVAFPSSNTTQAISRI